METGPGRIASAPGWRQVVPASAPLCFLVLGSLCSGTKDAWCQPCWDVDAGMDRQTQAGGGPEQPRPVPCRGSLAVPAVTPSSQGDY